MREVEFGASAPQPAPTDSPHAVSDQQGLLDHVVLALMRFTEMSQQVIEIEALEIESLEIEFGRNDPEIEFGHYDPELRLGTTTRRLSLGTTTQIFSNNFRQQTKVTNRCWALRP